ncbi:dinucleotide-utilizing enzyme [Microbacterium aquimaris]|uniref:Dinucleotide-utilizing enzyme n=1 Tax=Microbacterium aquimaris TaxID=459816 RepID=A0ABU5N8R9_9MICO|nr:dinucleotide-utilizing enzyme [Microbacterium aquimaris]MDZ8162487.1 dinucleotide-utilizing enzyme [Microbacterium aquimaris]
MTTRPRLVRSIPFWILLAGSAGVAGYGASMVTGTLDSMTTTLLDGSATGVDVYVGQSTAVVGAVLIGAGVLGFLLTLAVATAATLRPVTAPEVIEPPRADPDSELEDDATPVEAPTDDEIVDAEPTNSDRDPVRAD